MPSEGNLGLTARTVVELPIESLAFAVLENYVASDSWNCHNWMLGAERAGDEEQDGKQKGAGA
jgi:hypothetical protein